jgi:hypothetical protein
MMETDMTIADACFDFLHFDTDRTSWKEATERLLESIEWYGGPGAGPIFGYPPEHIDAPHRDRGGALASRRPSVLATAQSAR